MQGEERGREKMEVSKNQKLGFSQAYGIIARIL